MPADHRSRPTPRPDQRSSVVAARAAVIGVQVLLVSAAVHALAGGGLPDATGLAVTAALTTLVCWSVLRHTLGLVRAVALLALGQVALHVLLSLGGAAAHAGHRTTSTPLPTPPPSTAHHGHGSHVAHTLPPAADQGAGLGTGQSGSLPLADLLHLTPAMLGGHLAAVALTALLLLAQSRAVGAAADACALLLCLGRPVPAHPAPGGRPEHDRIPVLTSSAWTPCAPTRGPPAGLLHPAGH